MPLSKSESTSVSTSGSTSQSIQSRPVLATDGSAPNERAARTPAAGALVEHDYQRVFHGWPAFSLQGGDPYLIAGEGAVNLKTRVIDFEHGLSTWGAYEGDSLWFADNFMPMSACPEPSTLVQRVGKQWIPRLEVNVHSLVVHPWVKGSSLAAIVPFRPGPPWGYELTVLERNRTAPRPARRNANQFPECETRIAWFQTLVAFPSGEIFAFGGECGTQPLPEDEPEQLPDIDDTASDAPLDESVDPDYPELLPTVMESWHNGRHEFIDVPFRELSQVTGVGPKDMWATGTRRDQTWAVAYFDGAAWQVLPDYYDHRIVALLVYDGESGRDARRLVLTTEQLFETKRGAPAKRAVVEHQLPPGCKPHELTLDGEELWVQCLEDDEITLYTTRKDIAAFSFDIKAQGRNPVNFAEKAYPRLDPKAPSLRSCGSREFETPRPPSPKPPRGLGSKPLPHRGKSGSKLNYDGDFGF
jgi:hypothetical protein